MDTIELLYIVILDCSHNQIDDLHFYVLGYTASTFIKWKTSSPTPGASNLDVEDLAHRELVATEPEPAIFYLGLGKCWGAGAVEERLHADFTNGAEQVFEDPREPRASKLDRGLGVDLEELYLNVVRDEEVDTVELERVWEWLKGALGVRERGETEGYLEVNRHLECGLECVREDGRHLGHDRLDVLGSQRLVWLILRLRGRVGSH